MAMGKRGRQRQENLFIASNTLVKSPGHPFYEKLNQVLGANGFDEFVEGLCQRYYAPHMGRKGIPPGVYFRMLLIGYFEGLDSERGIEWRVSDSLTLRRFLGYALDEQTPDHSSLSRIRHRLPSPIYLRDNMPTVCLVCIKKIDQTGWNPGNLAQNATYPRNVSTPV